MTNLTMNKPRTFQGPTRGKNRYPVAGNLRIFAGSAAIEAGDGTATLAVAGGGDFLGFTTEEKDNRTGSIHGGTSGSTTVEIEQGGYVWLSVAHATTWALTDVGITVYASDSDTFLTTASTNIPIGKVAQVPAAAVGAGTALVLVYFEGVALRSI